MPRTMTSTASGSASGICFSRRFLRKLSSQRGRPKPAAKPRPSAASKSAADDEDQRRNATTPEHAGDDAEFLLRPVQPGLRDAGADSGGSLPSWLRRSSSLSDLLDLLAARALVARRRCGRAGSDLRDAGAALLGLPLAGQQRIDEDPGDAADRDGATMKSEGERLHRSWRRSLMHRLRRLRRRRARRQAASPRRNSARAPRIAAGRCRSSDAGR